MSIGGATDRGPALSTRPHAPAGLPLPRPAVKLPEFSAEVRKPPEAALQAARKRPLPPNVAMTKFSKHLAVLEAYPGQFVLRTSPTTAMAYPADAAQRGHLVAGRIFLTDPAGTRHKLRVYEVGAHAPLELGAADKMSFGGSGLDLGDDPISAVIALVLVVLFLLLLPLALVLWLRRRHRRTVVAKRMLAAAQIAGRQVPV